MLTTTLIVTAVATLVALVGLAIVVGLRLRRLMRELEDILEVVRPEVERLQEGVELAGAEWERVSSTPIRE
ncbi:MAG: hypothetical protein WDZ26_06315 [Nitriliruptoraceae bacterium]